MFAARFLLVPALLLFAKNRHPLLHPLNRAVCAACCPRPPNSRKASISHLHALKSLDLHSLFFCWRSPVSRETYVLSCRTFDSEPRPVCIYDWMLVVRHARLASTVYRWFGSIFKITNRQVCCFFTYLARVFFAGEARVSLHGCRCFSMYIRAQNRVN